MADKWKVFGYDSFDERRYPVFPVNEFDEESAARQRVKEELMTIERAQPRDDPGDREESEYQDYVILVHPDGVTEEVFNTSHLTC